MSDLLDLETERQWEYRQFLRNFVRGARKVVAGGSGVKRRFIGWLAFEWEVTACWWKWSIRKQKVTVVTCCFPKAQLQTTFAIWTRLRHPCSWLQALQDPASTGPQLSLNILWQPVYLPTSHLNGSSLRTRTVFYIPRPSWPLGIHRQMSEVEVDVVIGKMLIH